MNFFGKLLTNKHMLVQSLVIDNNYQVIDNYVYTIDIIVIIYVTIIIKS